MIKQLKQFTVNLVAGANVASVVLMLAAAYADRIYPAGYPMLSLMGLAFPLLLVANLAFLLFWISVKWRYCWITLAGYLLAFVPIRTYMPLNLTGQVPEGSIKILSWNVGSYSGNGKYDDAFEQIWKYIEQQQADIVCLQEDVDSWRRYMFNVMSKVYPYNDTTVFVNNALAFNGVGLHSRYPIVRKERIAYPSASNGSMAYYLKRGNDTLLVINNHLENTHLSLHDRARYRTMLRGDMEGDTARAESIQLIDKLSEAAAIRARAVDAVKAYIDSHRQYPLIVCGDFNDTPISYARHTLADQLTDCFVETGKGVGLSYNKKGFWVRIDHILCSQYFTPFNCEIDSKIDFSDHYPIACWLKMREK